jgi:hypothetical protein
MADAPRKADRFPPLAPPEPSRRTIRSARYVAGWWIVPGAACGFAFWAVIFKCAGWW